MCASYSKKPLRDSDLDSVCTAGLGRFETLAPDAKLTCLTATLGSKGDITIGYVNAEINGDNRPKAAAAFELPGIHYCQIEPIRSFRAV